ncbi:MAG: cysteine hydrolase [Elusimicrobia bacterium]|nr:cysteine hydrolase [Elusimicrobiota bacterium]
MSDTVGTVGEALLLVDCQRLFLDPASPAVLPGARRAGERAASLLADFRKAGRPVFHARFETRAASPMARRWRPVKGRWAEVWPTLAPSGREPALVKHSYSAFKGTGLAGRLRRAKVRRLRLAGFMTDLCVLATALDAFDLGLSVRVDGKACAARTRGLHAAALRAIARGFGDVV